MAILRNHQQGILCIKHLLKIWLRFNCIGFLIMLSSVAEHAAFSLQTQELKPEMSAESISSRYPFFHGAFRKRCGYVVPLRIIRVKCYTMLISRKFYPPFRFFVMGNSKKVNFSLFRVLTQVF